MSDTLARDHRASRHAALSASVTYGLLLAVQGIYQPYFPIWLADRGFGPNEIGILLSLPMAMRVAASPIAHFGDGALGPRRTFLLVVCGATLGFAALYAFHGFWTVAAVLTVTTACVAPTNPLLDVIVLHGVALHGHDYGRIRQWGSLGWLVASLATGFALTSLPPVAIPPILAILSALTVFAGLTLPENHATLSHAADTAQGKGPAAALFCVFALALACLQGSHAFLYAFGTLIWSGNGFSSGEIGLLWTVGVVFETAFFLVGGGFASRVGPYALIAFGGTVGLARWVFMGLDPRSGLVLAMLQAMHCFSFAAVHFGTMRWLARFTGGLASRQGLVNSAIGAGLAVGTVASGPLFKTLGIASFDAMAAASALGLALVAVAAAMERQSKR